MQARGRTCLLLPRRRVSAAAVVRGFIYMMSSIGRTPRCFFFRPSGFVVKSATRHRTDSSSSSSSSNTAPLRLLIALLSLLLLSTPVTKGDFDSSNNNNNNNSSSSNSNNRHHHHHHHDDSRGDNHHNNNNNNNNDNQCPAECACLGNVVDCSALQLTQTPVGLPPWTEILELKDNSIRELEDDALIHLTKLSKLDISGNKLKGNFTILLSNDTHLKELKINKNQLASIPQNLHLPDLIHLSLSHNLIERINGTTLRNFPELENLDISGNKLHALVKGSFLSPNRLTHLNLNINQIRVIENGSLDNLTMLEELRLNKNQITHFKDLFLNLERLRILELNRNEIQQVQGLSLKNLKNLEVLRLRRNKIDTLEDGAFWPLKNLLVLQLDFNMLTVIRNGGLFGLERLQKLTLEHNRIALIESQAWDICREITELDLSYNQLISIERGTFESLHKLERLKLDHNQITFIADGAFNNTPNLQVLELNSNKISYMVEDINGAFVPLRHLLKLELANNRIKSINKDAFSGLLRLKELDLTGNNITTVQENAFLSIPNLEELKMTTGSLVCDCGLQWLSVWLRERTFSAAKVHCGYPNWLKGMLLTQLSHANFSCDEFPKPRIVEEPSSRLTIKGDNVSLICRATSSANNTPLHFTWKHNHVELKHSNTETKIGSSSTGLTEASSILHLFNVTRANAGKYQCMVWNTYGTTYSSKAAINVLVYPVFSKVPQDILVDAGKTARLECSAEGQPSPQISWQKDGGNEIPAAKERRMHMMHSDPVLFIVNAKAADSGVYSCTAQNLAGQIVANATVTVLESPSFAKPMVNKEILAGGSIVLECMANGSPKPKLQWRKNGNLVQVTDRHFFAADDQLLIIVNANPSDAGTYECRMINSVGSIDGVSLLTVNPAVNEEDMLGLIIITVVCCAVGTSIVWVVIIYQTRRRLNARQNLNRTPTSVAVLQTAAEAQTHVYLETSSQHSKDSGTGDSTNPSNDQLQLYLPEEIAATSNEEDTNTVNGEDPLLQYTNHERNIRVSGQACEV